MYKFGNRSKERLEPAHPALQRVAYAAIEITKCDFTVLEVKREVERQKHLVAIGASQTMNSKHLVQPDGFVHAMDLGAWVGGEVRWEWPFYFQIAEAVKEASILHQTPIRWGGCWQNITEATQSPEELHLGYVQRKLAQGRKPFADGPHFELIV